MKTLAFILALAAFVLGFHTMVNGDVALGFAFFLMGAGMLLALRVDSLEERIRELENRL